MFVAVCVFILSLPFLISPPHPCGCCHGWEFYDVRKLCVHTRNGKCFQREHIQIQPTNRQLMNFTSQNTQKHSLTHTRTCTWRKSGIESGTPQHCGIRIILSRLLLLYRILSPSLNLSGTKCQLFGIFLFLRSFFSFRVFFSFPPLWVQTFSFFFFTNGIARGLFIF